MLAVSGREVEDAVLGGLVVCAQFPLVAFSSFCISLIWPSLRLQCLFLVLKCVHRSEARHRLAHTAGFPPFTLRNNWPGIQIFCSSWHEGGKVVVVDVNVVVVVVA